MLQDRGRVLVAWTKGKTGSTNTLRASDLCAPDCFRAFCSASFRAAASASALSCRFRCSLCCSLRPCSTQTVMLEPDLSCASISMHALGNFCDACADARCQCLETSALNGVHAIFNWVSSRFNELQIRIAYLVPVAPYMQASVFQNLLKNS